MPPGAKSGERSAITSRSATRWPHTFRKPKEARRRWWTQAAAAESDRLGDALVELETDGIAYGDFALTVAIHGPLSVTERLDGDIRRIFTSHDAKVIREGYGQLPAWFSRMPAQPRRRQVPLRVCISGRGGLHGSDLRAAGGNAAAAAT